jgi:putative peptide zinc metalloprotease protein
MNNSSAGFRSSVARPLKVRVRADLQVRSQCYAGQICQIVKDPIGLKYFRLHAEEFALLEMLDGERSLEDVKRQFEQRFAPQQLTFGQIQSFIAQAHRSNLVLGVAPGQGQQLWERSRELLRRKRIAALASILALRWRGIDPSWLLNRLLPMARLFFSPAAVVCGLLLCLSAPVLLWSQFDVFCSRLPAFHEFFSPANWFWLAMTLGGVKVLHELGHGLACKRLGGECHEIGFMLLIFTPALYCNVSDSWMLPNKWHRAAIGAAGMYVELLLAALATFLWWSSEPGLFNHLCLSVMFVCSVSTLLFNGNPLMRFDGYYILADLVEIPNLRQKATDLVQQFIVRTCCGIDLPGDPYLPPRRRLFLAGYGTASIVYRWIVMFSVVLFLNALLEPYGLQVFGQLLAVMAIATVMAPAAWRGAKFIRSPGRLDDWKRRRAATTTVAGLLISLVVALVPVPQYVSCPLTLEPAGAAGVFVATGGTLLRVSVKPGQAVERGDELACLSNPALKREVLRLRRECSELEQQIVAAERQRFVDRQAGLEVPQLREELVALRKQLGEKRVLEQNLRIKAPIGGVVYPTLRAAGGASSAGRHSRKSDWPLERSNCGAALAVGTELCRIGSATRWVGLLLIDQADIEWVARGQRVSIQLESDAGQILGGTISGIAECESAIAPASLSTGAGGTVAMRGDVDGTERPAQPMYQARVPVLAEGVVLASGLRGQARIHTGSRPLGVRIWRRLAATFQFAL